MTNSIKNGKRHFLIKMKNNEKDVVIENLIENKIDMYLSTIVVSEYAVADNPDNLLSLNTFQLLEFDFEQEP